MNENIDLTKILKNCPKGWNFYSSIYGKVLFDRISYGRIIVECVKLHRLVDFNWAGKYLIEESENNGTCFSSECLLFPSKEQRDWNKFEAPWYKKEKFDPKTLNTFDKVLVFDSNRPWTPLLFSYLEYSLNYPRMQCFDFAARKVIPYNKETKYLLGTHNEAPEYYRYWED